MANTDINFIPVFISVVKGNQAKWSVILSAQLQGLAMSRTRAFPELSLLQGVYSLGVVKILLLYDSKVVSVRTRKVGVLLETVSEFLSFFLLISLVGAHLLICSINNQKISLLPWECAYS